MPRLVFSAQSMVIGVPGALLLLFSFTEIGKVTFRESPESRENSGNASAGWRPKEFLLNLIAKSEILSKLVAFLKMSSNVKPSSVLWNDPFTSSPELSDLDFSVSFTNTFSGTLQYCDLEDGLLLSFPPIKSSTKSSLFCDVLSLECVGDRPSISSNKSDSLVLACFELSVV